MDKGIRPFIRAKFLELIPQYTPFGDRVNNAKFRADVIGSACEAFSISHASGATQYNEVFKEIKKETPDLVQGLGRPEDKKGGRKPKAPAVTQPAEQPTEQLPALPAEQTVFTVKKKSDGTVVAENLSFEDAKALVDKARAAKKAALFWV